MANFLRKKESEQQTAQLTDRPTDLPIVAPSVDVYENDDEILVFADMPGVAPDAVTIELDGGELRIGGPQAAVDDATASTSYQPVHVQRAFREPSTVDTGAVEATHDHGVLTLHLKKAEAAKPKKIKVHAA